MELITVRIPELNPQPSLSLEDKIPVWVAADNRTRHTSLDILRDLVLTGGDGQSLPVTYMGGSIIHIVTADEAGENYISIPAIAGKTFKLKRSGQPLIPYPFPNAEYECLSAGGPKLLQPGDKFLEGERLELDIFSLQGGAPSPGTGGGSALITGQVLITTNLTLNVADHIGKLISIRAGSSIITVTLPDITAVPADSIIPIETTILNNWQAKITTQGGQYIYMRNSNYTSLYMGISESLWLYRGEDGWYVINDFADNYARVGKIESSYRVGLNELLGNGALVARASFPRLWEEVQAMGSSLVSEAVWNTAAVYQQGSSFFTSPPAGTYTTINNPYRGCFSTGDGSTTFRLPNLMNMGLRGVQSISGSDTQRYLNSPGGYQRHEFELHNHVTAPWDKAGARASDIDGTNTTGGTDSTNNTTEFRVAAMGAYWTAATIQPKGGSETRMDNIGVLWTIKA